jgi:hypothetical protein
VPVTDPPGEFGHIPSDLFAKTIDVHVVIPRSVHLDELHPSTPDLLMADD